MHNIYKTLNLYEQKPPPWYKKENLENALEHWSAVCKKTLKMPFLRNLYRETKSRQIGTKKLLEGTCIQNFLATKRNLQDAKLN